MNNNQTSDKIKIVRWPDGTTCPLDEFDYELDWAWKGDDYEIIEIDEDEYNEENY